MGVCKQFETNCLNSEKKKQNAENSCSNIFFTLVTAVKIANYTSAQDIDHRHIIWYVSIAHSTVDVEMC